MEFLYKVVIIEDEPPAVKRLEKMLLKADAQLEVVAKLDSISNAVTYFKSNPEIDLVFMDIQLADGISFEIFSETNIDAPIIFTTAYDDFMAQAFKVNSIDYLLKPIDQPDLESAIAKYKKLTQKTARVDQSVVADLLKSIQQKSYKERFLIKSGQQLNVVPISEIAYFFSEDGYAHLVTKDRQKHLIEYTLDQLFNMLDPNTFFRINRKYFLHIDSIKKINSYFNSRLKLALSPQSSDDIIVSRERVGDFKRWLDR